jgi:hypothetical protein
VPPIHNEFLLLVFALCRNLLMMIYRVRALDPGVVRSGAASRFAADVAVSWPRSARQRAIILVGAASDNLA